MKGYISPSAQIQAVVELQNEAMDFFALKRVRDEIVGQGINRYLHPAFVYSDRFSINVTDALILTSALQTAFDLREQGDDLVFVSSDYRLRGAAQNTDLQIWNPEVDGAVRLLKSLL